MQYQELIAWQKAVELAVMLYRETRAFPHEELYGLRSQIRRSAVSIASNIAEGRGRATKGEFRHFIGIARGSFFELETQFYVARKLGYLTEDTYTFVAALSAELGRIISGLFRSLKAKS